MHQVWRARKAADMIELVVGTLSMSLANDTIIYLIY